MKTVPELYTDTALVRVLQMLLRQLEESLELHRPVDIYVAGGFILQAASQRTLMQNLEHASMSPGTWQLM